MQTKRGVGLESVLHVIHIGTSPSPHCSDAAEIFHLLLMHTRIPEIPFRVRAKGKITQTKIKNINFSILTCIMFRLLPLYSLSNKKR